VSGKTTPRVVARPPVATKGSAGTSSNGVGVAGRERQPLGETERSLGRLAVARLERPFGLGQTDARSDRPPAQRRSHLIEQVVGERRNGFVDLVVDGFVVRTGPGVSSQLAQPAQPVGRILCLGREVGQQPPGLALLRRCEVHESDPKRRAACGGRGSALAL
jgi:hypothetical protein